MVHLITWAARWGVPIEAVRELEHSMGLHNTEPVTAFSGTSEAAVTNALRLDAPKRGGRLWRNNVGALPDLTGRMVRYGLCNDSKKMNEVVKSSDLIGIDPLLIGPEHVGQVIGQFSAVECKEVGWRYTGTAHEVAQRNFGEMVLRLGGKFKFSNGSEL